MFRRKTIHGYHYHNYNTLFAQLNYLATEKTTYIPFVEYKRYRIISADERDGPSEVPGAKDGRGGGGEKEEGGDGGRLSQVS
jgi:hypothetical protein